MSNPASIKIIEIHAFRWTRKGNDKFDNGILERLRFGHVGIRVVGENPETSENIYSFRPKKPGDMPMDEFIERIKKRESFVGQVPREGDNVLFEIAKKYCVKFKTRIYSLDESYCPEIKKQLDSDIANSLLENKRYSLAPKPGDKWELNCYNCSTYLNTLGMETPYPSGRLGDYLERGEYEITIYRCS